MRSARYIFAAVLGICAWVGDSPLRAQSSAGSKDSGDIAVVVNAVNPETNISVAHLRRLLLGDRRFWAGNVRVKLVLRERGAHERDRVLTSLLDMDNRAFDEHWRAKVFRGESAEEPLTVPSKELVIEYALGTPGALTFMLEKDVPPQLKILRVEGKLPGEHGYALR
jgi:hypothetical protein